MTEAKEKDRVMAQIKARKHHSEIAGLEKHLDVLVDNGGYAKSRRTGSVARQNLNSGMD